MGLVLMLPWSQRPRVKRPPGVNYRPRGTWGWWVILGTYSGRLSIWGMTPLLFLLGGRSFNLDLEYVEGVGLLGFTMLGMAAPNADVKLFVGNLSFNTTTETIQEYFQQVRRLTGNGVGAGF